MSVEVQGASDPDADPITFQYEWFVNGVNVQTTNTSQPTNSLHLSQPGFGDKGDTISVSVTPMDSYQSGNTLSTAITVAASPAVINSVVLDNYLVNYSGIDSFELADDVVTAQLEVTNPDGDSISYRYLWSINGQGVQTIYASTIIDTLDLSQIGYGFSGAEVDLTVSIMDGGNVISQASANITDQSSPSSVAWASPQAFVGPLKPAASPSFVFPNGQTGFSFTAGEGAPRNTPIGQVTTQSTNGNPRAFAITTGNSNGWLRIDATGMISVAVESLPLTSTVQFAITVVAADSANPGLVANQVSASVMIYLKPTVVITGDFQGAATPFGGDNLDEIRLKFVRVTHDLSPTLPAPYTINWGAFD